MKYLNTLYLKLAFPAVFADFCSNQHHGQACGLPTVGVGGSQVQALLKIVFAVLAALSVLFIVIGGLRMVTAQGNPQEASKARSTIAYSVIGLIVALLGEAIVAFVLDRLLS